MTVQSNPWQERHPSAEQVTAEVHPTVETVQAELDEMLIEMHMADYWADLNKNHIDGTVFTHWDTITRRTYVQQFTQKQLLAGERILNGIESSTIRNA